MTLWLTWIIHLNAQIMVKNADYYDILHVMQFHICFLVQNPPSLVEPSHNNFSLRLGLTVTFFKVVSFSFCVISLKPVTSQVYFGNVLLPIVTRAISLNFCLRSMALFERTLPFETPFNTTITKSL